jgi:hypothetical protein
MRFGMLPLAVATLTSWLFVGPLAELLAVGEPGIHTTAEQPLRAVLTSPITLVALMMVMLGAAVWIFRERLAASIEWLAPLRRAACADFGFARLERATVCATRVAARALSSTQTGHLNWNVAVMLVGLGVIFGVLAMGGPA